MLKNSTKNKMVVILKGNTPKLLFFQSISKI